MGFLKNGFVKEKIRLNMPFFAAYGMAVNLFHADFVDPSRKAHWLEILKIHTQVPVH